MKRSIHFLLLFSMLLLAACAGRGTLGTVPEDAVITKKETILVASSRTLSAAPQFLGDGRSYTTNYANFQISIPPDRSPGEVNYPRGDQVDPRIEFLVAEVTNLIGQSDFTRAINDELTKQPANVRQGSVFVHGFNTNNAEAIMRATALALDTGREGVNVVYSWPSAASVLKYLDDRESALFARDAFEDTLTAMSQSRLKDYVVVGHSMGTFVVMDTIRGLAEKNNQTTLEKIKAVILISADIDIDVFRRQAPPVLLAGIPIILITAQDDLALRISSIIRGQDDRVGDVKSRSELGELNIPIFDFSDVTTGDPLKHFKIGSSPQILALLKSLNQSGGDLVADAVTGTADAQSLEAATGVVLTQ